MSARPAVVAAALILAMPVAAARQAAPPASDLAVDRSWKQIRRGDLTVMSDGSEALMRTAISELEGFQHAVQVLSPRAGGADAAAGSWTRWTSPVPTLLVLFTDEAAFDAYRPRDANGRKRDAVIGYFSEQPHVNYMVTFAQARGALNLSTILHEYTHFLASRNLRVIPAWLNEGLAEFYSTFESQGGDGRAMLGRVPADRLQTLQRGGTVRLEQMLKPESAALLMRDPRTASTFYAQSWALVHYLLIGHDGRRDGQLAAYLAALGDGRSPDQAFADAFHTSYGELQLELSIYMLRVRYPAVMVDAAPGAHAPAAPTAMLERDVLQRLGDLLVSAGAWREAESTLERAHALDPAFGPTEMSRGLLQIARRDTAAALRVLEPAARAAPDDFGLHYYLGRALLDDGRYADAGRVLTRATELVPDTSTAWFSLSLARLGTGDRRGADDALARAAAADVRPSWRYKRARFAWRMRLDDVIIDDVTAVLSNETLDAESAADAALLAAASSWRLHQPQRATRLLERVRARPDLPPWSATVLDFALGRLDGPSLVRLAKTPGERTSARTYYGLQSLFAGHRQQALPQLAWVRDRGGPAGLERAMVTDVLSTLED